MTLSDPQPVAHRLTLGETEKLKVAAAITCTSRVRHSVYVSATVINDPVNDPHAPAKATDDAWWQPSDIKPNSLPSAINVRKEGTVPFALLGTADFDPTTDLVRDSVEIGPSGSEVPATSCARSGEDTNADGRTDLVCFADGPALKAAGVTGDSTWLSIRGLLANGKDIFSQDAVKVLA